VSVAGSGEDAKKIGAIALERIYGAPNEVNIYTGEITRVRGDHVEYDLNSFTGCSGATVFVIQRSGSQCSTTTPEPDPPIVEARPTLEFKDQVRASPEEIESLSRRRLDPQRALAKTNVKIKRKTNEWPLIVSISIALPWSLFLFIF